MKNVDQLTLATLFSIILLVLAFELPPAKSEPPGNDYTLFWADEFNGTTLDSTKWDYRGLGKRRSAINTEDMVRLDGNGHLVLSTQLVGNEIHTAMIGTQDKFETTFGYFECRVRLQKTDGNWSAFWLQSPTITKTGDPKANGTEIDIYECFESQNGWVSHNLHWDGYGKAHKHIGSGQENVENLSQGYHTFGLEWTPDQYIFYIDEKESWRTNKAVSHVNEYIILSLEVGKKQAEIVRQDAHFSDNISVDWIRVFKKSR